jgi:membrane protease subunit HflC
MGPRQLSLIAIAALLALALYDTFYTVRQRESAALFQFGELKTADIGPGLHAKLPFAQTAQRFDNRLQTLERDTESFMTAEKKSVLVDYFVKWRIADLGSYYRATGGQLLSASDRLGAIVNRGLRDAVGTRTIQQIVADDGDQMLAHTLNGAAEEARGLGIEIVDVRVTAINLPEAVADSVYSRMRAERTAVASDLRARGAEQAEKIRAEADQQAQVLLADAYRDAEKMRGEGDAKASQIYAKAYGEDPEFFRFYRSMSAYRDAFEDSQNTLVLDPHSDFFRFFNAPGAGPGTGPGTGPGRGK